MYSKEVEKKNFIKFILSLIWNIFWIFILPIGGVFYISHFILHIKASNTYCITSLFFLVFFFIFNIFYNELFKFYSFLNREKIIKTLKLAWKFLFILCMIILFIFCLSEKFSITRIILQFIAYNLVLGLALLSIKIGARLGLSFSKKEPQVAMDLHIKKLNWKIIKRLMIWIINLLVIAILSFVAIYLIGVKNLPFLGILILGCIISYISLFIHLVSCDIRKRFLSYKELKNSQV
jgi:hypothetical protein